MVVARFANVGLEVRHTIDGRPLRSLAIEPVVKDGAHQAVGQAADLAAGRVRLATVLAAVQECCSEVEILTRRGPSWIPMIVSSRKHVDLLYALFLGRLPEDNFVREQNIGRPMIDIANAMIGSEEFAQSVIERFLLHKRLPHRDLPLKLLPEVLQLIAAAGLAPPRPGMSVADWQAVLGYVLSTMPCRGFLQVRHGETGRQLLERLIGLGSGEGQDATGRGAEAQERLPPSEPDIASGGEIIANTICRGWVIDRNNPDALLHIRLRLNGRTVKILAADEFRRDVQDRYGGEGRTGFTIHLDHLTDAPHLSRGTVEITELSRGAIVLPEQVVEFSPLPAIRVEAELREALSRVRDRLDRLQSPAPPDSSSRSRNPLALAVQQLRARVGKHKLPRARDELSELLGALDRLEQQLPKLERGQSWALPLYGAVAPLVEMVTPPPAIANPASLSLIVIDYGRVQGAGEATLVSVLAQTHRPHEICLLARSGTPVGLASAPEGVEILPLAPDQPANAAVNGVAARLTGSHLLVLDAGLTLAPEALAWFAAAIESTSAPIIYTDAEIVHDPRTGTGARQPWFRPAFDYDLLLQRNYIGDTFCIERQAYTVLDGLSIDPSLDARHDLLLRAHARFGRSAFAHLPLLLVRSTTFPSPAEPEAGRDDDTIRRTVQRHLDRIGSDSRAFAHEDAFGRPVPDALGVDWREDAKSRLSVIIPTRDSADMVFALISSLRRHAAAWDRVEIIVVVNGKLEFRLRSAFAEIENMFDQVRVVYHPVDFNWADINNGAVRDHASGELLLFMNDDMICLSHNWDRRVRSQLARSEIGVIGGRLLYPNGAIQHAGIAFGEGAMTAHEAMGDDAGDGLYLDRTLLVHEIGAVTGALLACRRSLFDSLCGFDAQRYAVTSSDADFCVRTRLADKAVIYDPFLTWIHYESVSRGSDTHDYKRHWRADAEHELWRSRFSEIDLVDLSVNPHLARSRRPFETFHRLARQEIELWFSAQLAHHRRLGQVRVDP